MRKDKLIGKNVLLRNVYYFDNNNGVITEEYRDIVGILDKIGPNSFFGWALSATINGSCYKIETLSQIQPIYK